VALGSLDAMLTSTVGRRQAMRSCATLFFVI
jgi:hypothetical protein